MQGSWGYLSPDPCRVCQRVRNNQMHPRLGYVVCEEHQDVPAYRIPPLPPSQEREKLKNPLPSRP